MEEDLEKTQTPNRATESKSTESSEAAAAKTAKLPRLDSGAFRLEAAKKEDEFCIGQSRILQKLAANAPLNQILERLLLLIEDQAPDMLCSVLLLSEDGDHIRHGAAPSLSPEYVKAIDGLAIGPKNGSCGTAMYRGEPVVVTDIASDPLWEDYRAFALADGLRACWSTPILSGQGKVLGSFAIYYREPRSPTGEEAGLTEVATRIAGLAIEHHAAKEILARTQAELAKASDAASKGKAATASLDEINQQLEAMLSTAKRCLELLDEDKPDIASFRGPLTIITKSGQQALDIIARIRS